MEKVVLSSLEEDKELSLTDEWMSQLQVGSAPATRGRKKHPIIIRGGGGRRKRAKTKSKNGRGIGGNLTLSLSLRVEKNVICLILGRRVIKTLVKRTAGKHGAKLVDLVYKLARITLGKREAKKLMKRTLNIIAEVSVLTIHGKLSPHLLDLMKTALLTPLKTFQEMQNTEPSSILKKWSREEQERIFTASVQGAEKELFLLLHPLVQERTLGRFGKVARTLRDPAIVSACFLQEDEVEVDAEFGQGARRLVQEMLNTMEEMAGEQRERVSKSKSKTKSKSRSRRRRQSKKPATTSAK